MQVNNFVEHEARVVDMIAATLNLLRCRSGPSRVDEARSSFSVSLEPLAAAHASIGWSTSIIELIDIEKPTPGPGGRCEELTISIEGTCFTDLGQSPFPSRFPPSRLLFSQAWNAPLPHISTPRSSPDPVCYSFVPLLSRDPFIADLPPSTVCA